MPKHVDNGKEPNKNSSIRLSQDGRDKLAELNHIYGSNGKAVEVLLKAYKTAESLCEVNEDFKKYFDIMYAK